MISEYTLFHIELQNNMHQCIIYVIVLFEFHHLFICPVFQEDRNRLLKEYYRKFPRLYKFVELMSTTNMKDLRKLAQFATIIIRKFQ